MKPYRLLAIVAILAMLITGLSFTKIASASPLAQCASDGYGDQACNDTHNLPVGGVIITSVKQHGNTITFTWDTASQFDRFIVRWHREGGEEPQEDVGNRTYQFTIYDVWPASHYVVKVEGYPSDTGFDESSIDTCVTYSMNNAIYTRWQQLGAESSYLGCPTTNITPTPDGVGYFNRFQRGSIYWSPASGAHEIHGYIFDKWAQVGYERGAYGYPTTDVTHTPDGRGRFVHFSKGGSIYWSAATGAHTVHGAIRQKWAYLGWERSSLGYPLTDETPTPDHIGYFNYFQHGAIYWTQATGAHEIHGPILDKWASLLWERGRLGYPTSDQYGVYGGVRSDFQHGSITLYNNGYIQVDYH